MCVMGLAVHRNEVVRSWETGQHGHKLKTLHLETRLRDLLNYQGFSSHSLEALRKG